MSVKYTRRDYLNKKCTHDEYYRQFVTSETIDQVVEGVGTIVIVNCEDSNFNDVPLYCWDQLADYLDYNIELFREANSKMLPSISELVCIAKTAARMYHESH